MKNFPFKLPLILDGATGTELQKRGLPAGVCPEKWILENPDKIIDIQKRYVAAGSDIIYAPTFTANRVKLGHYDIADVAGFCGGLVALTKNAAGGKSLVGGDMSALGLFIAPYGSGDFEEFVGVYREQAKALSYAGVDMFAVETMITLPEARAAVLAIREASDKPIFVTFTCDDNGRTMMGTDVAAALVIMQGMGVSAFGLNCSTGPDILAKQLRRIAPYAEVPLISKPNAGLPIVEGGHTSYDCPPDVFASGIAGMTDFGVCIFGGCCGTDESHISALAEAVRASDFSECTVECGGKAVCASDRDFFVIDENTTFSSPIPCGEDFADDAEEASDSFDILTVLVDDKNALSCFRESAYAIRSGLRVLSHDRVIFENVLRLYQGRAVYDSGCGFDAGFLDLMSDKYGLVVL